MTATTRYKNIRTPRTPPSVQFIVSLFPVAALVVDGRTVRAFLGNNRFFDTVVRGDRTLREGYAVWLMQKGFPFFQMRLPLRVDQLIRTSKQTISNSRREFLMTSRICSDPCCYSLVLTSRTSLVRAGPVALRSFGRTHRLFLIVGILVPLSEKASELVEKDDLVVLLSVVFPVLSARGRFRPR
jgi:hypothetical protein